MRKLAHIEKIEWKRPIEGADRIELVGVLGWQCIAKKDEFQVGDRCVYIEIDSLVDSTNPDFAFLENKKYKIKTMRMRGVLSQGIVFPLDILHSGKHFDIGTDVTDILKIKKIEDEPIKTVRVNPVNALKQRYKKLYNNKVFKFFMKFSWFRKIAFQLLLNRKKPKKFPDWIKKTDETRLQSMPFVLETYKETEMVETEKLDGTSTTFGLKKLKRKFLFFGKKYDFAVCSRNIRQVDISQKCYYEDNVYHEMAIKYNVKEVLIKLMEKFNANTVVLQGETIGEGIQGNKYGLKGRDWYAFNLEVDGKRINSAVATDIVHEYGIKWVPIITAKFKMLSSVDEMLLHADGKSVLADTLREGSVFRDAANTVSFKCVSNKFLLAHNL